jgi:hypothetical protein
MTQIEMRQLMKEAGVIFAVAVDSFWLVAA